MDGSFVFEFFVFALGWPNTKNKSPCTITDAVHRNRIRLVRTKRTCRPCRLWTELDSHWDPDILHAHKSNTIKLSLHQRSRHSQYPASLLVQHPFLHFCLCLHCLWPCTLPCCCTSIVVKSRGENLSVFATTKCKYSCTTIEFICSESGNWMAMTKADNLTVNHATWWNNCNDLGGKKRFALQVPGQAGGGKEVQGKNKNVPIGRVQDDQDDQCSGRMLSCHLFLLSSLSLDVSFSFLTALSHGYPIADFFEIRL